MVCWFLWPAKIMCHLLQQVSNMRLQLTKPPFKCGYSIQRRIAKNCKKSQSHAAAVSISWWGRARLNDWKILLLLNKTDFFPLLLWLNLVIFILLWSSHFSIHDIFWFVCLLKAEQWNLTLVYKFSFVHFCFQTLVIFIFYQEMDNFS